jgi:hypothetical protein
MKKALVASILGIAATVGSSHAQGWIYFNNYSATAGGQVTYGNTTSDQTSLGGLAGTPVTDANVELQLFYAIGTFGSTSSFLAAATPGVTTFIDSGATYAGGGYYEGGTQTIAGWTALDTVTFMVEAWETSGPLAGATFATSGLAGESGLWTEVAGSPAGGNGVQPTTDPAQFFNSGPPAMTIDTVPEPSTIALGGLGMASLLALRRRK